MTFEPGENAGAELGDHIQDLSRKIQVTVGVTAMLISACQRFTCQLTADSIAYRIVCQQSNLTPSVWH